MSLLEIYQHIDYWEHQVTKAWQLRHIKAAGGRSNVRRCLGRLREWKTLQNAYYETH